MAPEAQVSDTDTQATEEAYYLEHPDQEPDPQSRKFVKRDPCLEDSGATDPDAFPSGSLSRDPMPSGHAVGRSTREKISRNRTRTRPWNLSSHPPSPSRLCVWHSAATRCSADALEAASLDKAAASLRELHGGSWAVLFLTARGQMGCDPSWLSDQAFPDLAWLLDSLGFPFAIGVLDDSPLHIHVLAFAPSPTDLDAAERSLLSRLSVLGLDCWRNWNPDKAVQRVRRISARPSDRDVYDYVAGHVFPEPVPPWKGCPQPQPGPASWLVHLPAPIPGDPK